MNRKSWVALLIGLLLADPAFADRDWQVPADLSKSLVRVRVVNETRRLANGSGVAVSENMVITSCHGTRKARWVDILARGQSWNVIRLIEDVEHDLCLLVVERDVFEPFALAGDNPGLQLGDYVAAVGFAGPQVVVAEGSVNALYSHDQAKVIQTDAPFTGGESGGALLDREGRLAGVLTFFANGNRGGYFAVPSGWVEKLLQRAADGHAVDAQADVSFWERPDAELPQFLRALAREYAGDWDGLRHVAQQWVERERLNPEAWIALGKAHHYATQQADAVEALLEGVKLAPRHAQGWYYLGRAHFALNERREFYAVLRQLEVLNPGTAQALRNAVRALR